METDTDNVFTTTDPSLAAYLFVNNIPLQRIEPHNARCILIFDMPPESMIEDFRTGRGQVSALLYYRAYKSLLNRINAKMKEWDRLARQQRL